MIVMSNRAEPNVSALRARIAELEEMVLQLTTSPDAEIVLPSGSHLSPVESALLRQLIRRSFISADVACATINATTHRDTSDSNSLAVHVCRIRKKLRAFGIDVISVRGNGYRITEESREVMTGWLQ